MTDKYLKRFSPKIKVSQYTCFVIGPIGSESSKTRERADVVFDLIIKKSLEDFNVHTIRADHISKPGQITEQIVNAIIDSDFIIADLEGYNPNVMYELGLAHSFRKQVIQLYPGDRIPFDLYGQRSVKLDIDDFKQGFITIDEIKKQVASILENPDEVSNPISAAIDIKQLGTSEDKTNRLLSDIIITQNKILKVVEEFEIPKMATTDEKVLSSKVVPKEISKKEVPQPITVDSSVFSHPITYRLFLHFKLEDPSEFGVREMQRIMGINSPSTITWHFNKLAEAGLLEQKRNKRYGLTEAGSSYNDIRIPVNIPAQIVFGRFVPRYSMLLGILFFGFILNSILLILGFEPLRIAVSTIMNVLLALIIVIRDWTSLQKEFDQFDSSS